MTCLAIRHCEPRIDVLCHVVAPHTIHHFRQRQIGQTCAARHGVLARRAVQVVTVFIPEMSDVCELQIDVNTGDHMIRNQRPFLCKTRVLDFFR